MNTVKEILVAVSLVFSLGAISITAVEAVSQTGMAQPINNTIAHLEASLGAVNANDLKAAQEHINAARQTSKEIIGGSLEARAAEGSRAIVNARRSAMEGDKAGAAAALTEALEVFKSMLLPFKAGSRGGLK